MHQILDATNQYEVNSYIYQCIKEPQLVSR